MQTTCRAQLRAPPRHPASAAPRPNCGRAFPNEQTSTNAACGDLLRWVVDPWRGSRLATSRDFAVRRVCMRRWRGRPHQSGARWYGGPRATTACKRIARRTHSRSPSATRAKGPSPNAKGRHKMRSCTSAPLGKHARSWAKEGRSHGAEAGPADGPSSLTTRSLTPACRCPKPLETNALPQSRSSMT